MKWFLSVVGFFVCVSFLGCGGDSDKKISQARSSSSSSVSYSVGFVDEFWIDASDFTAIENGVVMDELDIIEIRLDGELIRSTFSLNFFESESSCVVNNKLECVLVSDDALKKFVELHSTPDNFSEMLESIDRVYVKFSKINDNRFRSDYLMMEFKDGSSEIDPEFDGQTFVKTTGREADIVIDYIAEHFKVLSR